MPAEKPRWPPRTVELGLQSGIFTFRYELDQIPRGKVLEHHARLGFRDELDQIARGGVFEGHALGIEGRVPFQRVVVAGIQIVRTEERRSASYSSHESLRSAGVPRRGHLGG